MRPVSMLAGVVLLCWGLGLVLGADPPVPKAESPPPSIEGKLVGTWIGGPCMGTLIIGADGRFERRHYSPGNNELSGTWSLRWDALPPKLVMKCEASDDPDRVGKTTELRVLKLDDGHLVYRYLESRTPSRYERAPVSAKAE